MTSAPSGARRSANRCASVPETSIGVRSPLPGTGDIPGAAVALGSAFNPAGTAGSVYAGQQAQNSTNPASVSQYDVACFQQPRH